MVNGSRLQLDIRAEQTAARNTHTAAAHNTHTPAACNTHTHSNSMQHTHTHTPAARNTHTHSSGGGWRSKQSLLDQREEEEKGEGKNECGVKSNGRVEGWNMEAEEEGGRVEAALKDRPALLLNFFSVEKKKKTLAPKKKKPYINQR